MTITSFTPDGCLRQNYEADGEIDRFKARIVACGNYLLSRVYYGLSFAVVMELSTVKMILGFARKWGLPTGHRIFHMRM